jgi:hypothetical protein
MRYPGSRTIREGIRSQLDRRSARTTALLDLVAQWKHATSRLYPQRQRWLHLVEHGHREHRPSVFQREHTGNPGLCAGQDRFDPRRFWLFRRQSDIQAAKSCVHWRRNHGELAHGEPSELDQQRRGRKHDCSNACPVSGRRNQPASRRGALFSVGQRTLSRKTGPTSMNAARAHAKTSAR